MHPEVSPWLNCSMALKPKVAQVLAGIWLKFSLTFTVLALCRQCGPLCSQPSILGMKKDRPGLVDPFAYGPISLLSIQLHLQRGFCTFDSLRRK